NVINIFVYVKIGLKDCINICFFVLSFTDLASVLVLILNNVSYMFTDAFEELWNINGKNLTFLITFYYGAIYDISQGITTFIAVQKCWCVALPFRFKNTFSASRTYVILSGISIMILSMHLPILATQGLQETILPDTNRTLLVLWTAEIRQQIFPVIALMSVIFTTTCQFTVIFCLIVLASTLRASSKFRNSSASSNMRPLTTYLKSGTAKGSGNIYWNKYKFCCKKMNDGHWHDAENQVGEISASDCKNIEPVPLQNKITSSKELQAIKSTTIVSVLFISFNTFKLLNSYVILCVADYSLYGRFSNTYKMTNSIRLFFEELHMSCNMFVYLKFNSRFTKTLSATCGCG
ncbi:unnamed protein product, partial [Lymnaea stagnalis]